MKIFILLGGLLCVIQHPTYSPHFLCRKLYNGYYVNINDLLTLAMKYLQKVFRMGKDKNENEKGGRPFSVILFFGDMNDCLFVCFAGVFRFEV